MIVDKNNYNIEHFHKSELIPSTSKEKPQDLITTRENHMKASLDNICIDGDILEFGVHTGKSINLISSVLKDKVVHGFDSFEGLPEDWKISNNRIYRQGHFKVDDLPPVNDNVILWKGWFSDTIQQYLKSEHNSKKISFLHIDGDLYSSCIDVLYGLNDCIVKNTIIVFDEMYPWGRKSYPNWKENEYKACHEWITKYERKFTVLYHNEHQQCAIKVVD